MLLDFQSPLYLLYISTIAGLATTAGCLIVLFLGDPPDQLLAVLLSAAGGVMFAVVAFDLLPLAVSFKQPGLLLGGILAGVMLMSSADKLLKARSRQLSGHRDSRLKRMGILIASGIALHDIPEGMAIAAGHESTGPLGTFIALGIALHNLPEGMATATPLVMAGIRKPKILVLTLLIAIFTPLGALLGRVAMELVHTSLCFFVALAAGAMIFLVLAELWPLARENHPIWAFLGGISGFILFGIISVFLPH
ncbi:ZIP family metal transporter [Dehalobacter sp.]|uniref:ZIP family metal transporter n=1 Tax=Dehalobacter sp. TaxID=1962289 RepID=UPI00258A58A1|nr:ZIP family metal transporter [Dehalobacter sp.]MCG1024875.1 ZIP family metal transporter [Dehalobacter sp.]